MKKFLVIVFALLNFNVFATTYYVDGLGGNSLFGDHVRFEFDFIDGNQGWVAGFADYPVGSEEFYELQSEWQQLPLPLDLTHGLFVSGKNHSDDLLMFIKTQVEGLQPATRYAISFEVEFATDVASGCVGIGGSPGESVYIKAGAAPFEPMPQIIDSYYHLNIDHGNQSQGGNDAIVIGNFANSQTDCFDGGYEFKTLTNSDQPFEQVADGDGRLWLIFATDSGFEGKTSIYYTNVMVEVDELSSIDIIFQNDFE